MSGGHAGAFDNGFYQWFADEIHSSSGGPVLGLAVFLIAVTSEALSAAVSRLRSRPVFWIRSRKVTVVLHNLVSTLTHTLRMLLMFLMMVVFMAMNVWMCVAVVGGSAVGYLFFHWSSVWDSEAPDKDDAARSQW